VVVDPNIFARTERLLLRPLRAEDAEDILLMRKHPEVMKHSSILPSDDIEGTKAWIQGVRMFSLKTTSVRILIACSATRLKATGTLQSSSYRRTKAPMSSV
jgi:RimJ/RimL family protein N-acetyltransferase